MSNLSLLIHSVFFWFENTQKPFFPDIPSVILFFYSCSVEYVALQPKEIPSNVTSIFYFKVSSSFYYSECWRTTRIDRVVHDRLCVESIRVHVFFSIHNCHTQKRKSLSERISVRGKMRRRLSHDPTVPRYCAIIRERTGVRSAQFVVQ